MNKARPSPLVSVLMSVYNAEETLEESINSILNQTYQHFELIIMNDGSTDSSKDILKNFQKRSDKIILINQDNAGLTISLNRALKIAKGSLIARQDSDDFSLPERLERQVLEFEKKPELLLLGSSSLDLYPDGTQKSWGYTSDKDIQKTVQLCVPFPHSTAMMRADILKKLGGYNDSWKTSQDMELWMRFARQGEISMLPDHLIRRRIHKNTISKRRKFRQFYDALRARWRYYEGSKLYVLYYSLRALTIALLPDAAVQKLKALKSKICVPKA